MANVTIQQIDDLTASVRKLGALLRGADSATETRDAEWLTGMAYEEIKVTESIIDAINEGAD